jgi:hypothetical protein
VDAGVSGAKESRSALDALTSTPLPFIADPFFVLTFVGRIPRL